MILTGRTMALLAAGALVAILARNEVLMFIWTGVVLLAAFADWLLIPNLRQLSVTRDPIPPVRLSNSTRAPLLITNTGTRAVRGELRDAWQPSAGASVASASVTKATVTGANLADSSGPRHPLDLPGGQSRVLVTVLRPRRRGNLAAHFVAIRAKSAAGLAIRQATIPAPATLKVLPEFRARKHLPSRLARLRELDGSASVLVRGEGTEFDSLRDYVDGDDVRSIDWRATARREELVVRTWRPERDRRVIIVLDTSRLSAARLGEETRLDAGIETALLMTALASHAGDRVDVIALDQQLRARVSKHRGAAALTALAEAVGPLTPELTEPDWSLMARSVSELVTGRALVIVCTAIEPGVLGTGMLAALAALAGKHQVLIASATDPTEAQLRTARETSEDAYIAAAAERAAVDRSEVARVLQSGSTLIVQELPDDLAPAVADAYISLKTAGRL